jgi:hypothetical protein
MAFTSEGKFKVKIVEAMIAEPNPKFTTDPHAFDIALKVESVDNPAVSDWWKSTVSGDYGQGTFSDRTRAQITLKSLEDIGWEHGTDFGQIETLVGTVTIATVEPSKKPKSDGTPYYNVKYLGEGGIAPKAMDKDEARRRAAALFGGTAAATTTPAQVVPATAGANAKPVTTAAQPAARTNPFAKK